MNPVDEKDARVLLEAVRTMHPTQVRMKLEHALMGASDRGDEPAKRLIVRTLELLTFEEKRLSPDP